MAALLPSSQEARRIDAALGSWRQGDLALDERWFVHVADPAESLTEASASADEPGIEAVTSEVRGLVVVTQTCDIVRSATERPYLEVCPLVEIPEDKFLNVQRGRMPAYATLPAVATARLAADLDRVMTVEKSVVARWQRTPGYTDDGAARTFALALARKRVRFAFPDEFTALANPLQSRLIAKHNRDSEEGKALRALREIRVQASPSWDAAQIDLLFWFIREDGEPTFNGKSWGDFLEDWLKVMSASGRFRSVLGQVATLEDMTAADFVRSDVLDLDHLSHSGTSR